MSVPAVEAIEALVRTVLAGLNADLPAQDRFAVDDRTVIMGEGGVLDSLGIANFIVQLEEQMEQTFGHAATLSDQDLMQLFEGEVATIEVVARQLHQRLNA